MTNSTLDEIKARRDAATKGPWKVVSLHSHHLAIHGEGPIAQYVPFLNGNPHYESDVQNFTFIAHSRTDIDWLIAELERANSKLFIAIEALEKLENGDHVGTSINENSGAMLVIRDALNQLPVAARPVLPINRAAGCGE